MRKFLERISRRGPKGIDMGGFITNYEEVGHLPRFVSSKDVK